MNCFSLCLKTTLKTHVTNMEQSVIDKNLTVKQGADEMGSTSISNKWINVGSPYTHIHFKEAQA